MMHAKKVDQIPSYFTPPYNWAGTNNQAFTAQSPRPLVVSNIPLACAGLKRLSLLSVQSLIKILYPVKKLTQSFL